MFECEAQWKHQESRAKYQGGQHQALAQRIKFLPVACHEKRSRVEGVDGPVGQQ